MLPNQHSKGKEIIEEHLNDAQILFDEADDVAVPKSTYKNKQGIYLISPSSAVADPKSIDMAASRLKRMGFKVKIDAAAAAVATRFAGSDQDRALAFSRAAKSKSSIVMATRGGYGLSRILHQIDWRLLEKNPKKYVGFSDFTIFNLALLAKTWMPSYTGPCAVTDFGGSKVEALNAEIFMESMYGELEVLNFESPDSDPVDAYGTLWGGNLTSICSLLGTPYFPKVKKGILFIEDVSEHPYRIERLLTQLLHAGVLHKQRAIILGDFNDYKLVASDNGFNLTMVIQWLREQIKVPVITGLPYGHLKMRVTLPIGQKVGVATEGGIAYLVLDVHDHKHDHKHSHDHH